MLAAKALITQLPDVLRPYEYRFSRTYVAYAGNTIDRNRIVGKRDCARLGGQFICRI